MDSLFNRKSKFRLRTRTLESAIRAVVFRFKFLKRNRKRFLLRSCLILAITSGYVAAGDRGDAGDRENNDWRDERSRDSAKREAEEKDRSCMRGFERERESGLLCGIPYMHETPGERK